MSEADLVNRTWYRIRNITARGTVTLVDDSTPVQLHQVEVLPGEIRERVQNFQPFGLSAVPLPGAKVSVNWQSGHRSLGSVHGVEDPRYRPTGGQPGEVTLYMVDGAGLTGAGGTLRRVLRGLAGWLAELTGRTIAIGDAADTVTVSITSGGALTITGVTGDVVVNGVSLVNHVHTGVQPGSGTSGPPAGA